MKALINAIDRFCSRHPNFGVSNLMMYIVIGNVAVYLLDMTSNYTCTAMLYFSRDYILQGEVWRLVSYIFVPTYSGSVLLTALTLYCYYLVGRSIERQWGSAKFSIFYLTGMVINIIFGMITGYTSIYYVNMSMFFALATLFPDWQVLFMFIIPIKMKWMAWINAGYFVYMVFADSYPGNLLPLVAFINYLVFFGDGILDYIGMLLGAKQRRRDWDRKQAQNRSAKVSDFKKETRRIQQDRGYLHRCAVCGKTDVSDPDLEFRYCSRCQGYYCYCMDHISSHIHIVE